MRKRRGGRGSQLLSRIRAEKNAEVPEQTSSGPVVRKAREESVLTPQRPELRREKVSITETTGGKGK